MFKIDNNYLPFLIKSPKHNRQRASFKRQLLLIQISFTKLSIICFSLPFILSTSLLQIFYKAKDRNLQLDSPFSWDLTQLDGITKCWSTSIRIFYFRINLLPDPLAAVNRGLDDVLWGTAQVQQCLKQLRSQSRTKCSWQLQVELGTHLEHNQPVTKPILLRTTAVTLLCSVRRTSPCSNMWYHQALPFLCSHGPWDWCLSAEHHVFSPKGLQLSFLLHIPHIFTRLKGKQLCHIFRLTSWKEKQRKLQSEVLFCAIEHINDAFPTSSTFPSKLTC